MSRTTQQLTAEIEQLTERKAELLPQFTQAVASHQSTQERLLHGDETLAVGTVSLHHSLAQSLQTAIAEIDGRLSQLNKQLKVAEVDEQLLSSRSRLKVALGELRECEDLYRHQRVQLNAILENQCGEIVTTFQHWRKLTREVASLRQRLGEQVVKQRPIPSPEPLVFGREIDTCAQLLLNQMSNPAREARKSRSRSWAGTSARSKLAAQAVATTAHQQVNETELMKHAKGDSEWQRQ
jgi:hypothetical protein